MPTVGLEPPRVHVTAGPCAVARCRELAEFKRVFDVNVFGTFAAIQAFFPLVKVRTPRCLAGVSHCIMSTARCALPRCPDNGCPVDTAHTCGEHNSALTFPAFCWRNRQRWVQSSYLGSAKSLCDTV